MKPDWDKLMKEYKSHDSILIADVDCTAAGKPLCDSNGVRGFPTIKYGDPDDLQDYEGGRDLKSLKEHAKTKLGPQCGPKNMDLCDAAQKAKIDEVMAMSDADIAAKIKEGEKAMEDAEANFKKEVEKLQKKYESLSKEKDDTIKQVKDSGLSTYKQVKAFKASGAKKEEL